MATYKTPGVYVEEITTLPPSVAEVETAIPAFIGFTELGGKNVPKRITSLVEYQEYFGGAEPERNISVTLERGAGGAPDAKVVGVTINPDTKSKNVLYYAMQLYFANGGGPCYIVPAGNYADSANDPMGAYGDALRASSKEDEPTLLVFPDAFFILGPDDYYGLMNDALSECARLGDRFAIIDVQNVAGDSQASTAGFRQRISANLDQIKYGAAYYPPVNTIINYQYNPEDVTVMEAGDNAAARLVPDTQAAAAAANRDAAEARTESDRLKTLADAEGADKAAKDEAKRADQRARDLEAKAREARTQCRCRYPVCNPPYLGRPKQCRAEPN